MELFESIMWKYISEEKDVLTANIERKDIQPVAEQLAGYSTIYFVSHGSSYNSSMTVTPFFMKNARINVHCITAGNFIACIGKTYIFVIPIVVFDACRKC